VVAGEGEVVGEVGEVGEVEEVEVADRSSVRV
jgi:hypothetical protein